MPEDIIFDEIFRIELEDLESDFSATKSFTEAVAKAKQEIAKSFEESLAEADKVRVKIKEPQPA